MRSIARVLSAGILSAGTCGALTLAGAPAASAATAVAGGAPVPVIAFLGYQPALTAAGAAGLQTRAQSIDAAQVPFLSLLRQLGATRVKTYRLVDAVAATLSPAAVRQLAATPGVTSVIPDSPIAGPRATAVQEAPGLAAGATASRVLPGACRASGAELEPEGLSLTLTDTALRGVRTARSLGFTGAGVTVGFLADGIDPSNVNLMRGGRPVIADYRDFSGAGTAAPTEGGVAFGDANAIAGQGTHVYTTRGFSAQSPASPCDVRIEGAAPGASLDALKVFGRDNVASTSGFLQAIDYAVIVDRVDVLDESFSASPFPDVSSLDAVQQFNDTASAAGVTVVVASGDAGPLNTIGSPATDPHVLSVGASTDFRFYAQTDYAAADLFARTGWLNDNISSISSGGYTQTGGTVDMLAPGDLSFASCTANLSLFTDCANFVGRASPLEQTGGTSQSASMAAGAAALVIQAYRKAHGGTTPAPALVRRILLSTATDLGAPATEQGAGLLNSLKAVELAQSAPGRAAPGETLRLSSNQLNGIATPGTKKTWTVTVTNTGTARQVVSLSGRTFGAPTVVGAGSVTLSDAKSRHFSNWSGVAANFGELGFTVPAGEARLDASITWHASAAQQANSAAQVRLILVDPLGRFAADSLPQDDAGFGSAQVLHPAAGRWTAVIFSDASGAHGTTGRVLFGASASRYAAFGTVRPASLSLARGASGTVTVSAVVPPGAGDSSGALVIDGGSGATSVPVTVRGLIDAVADGGGSFHGVLTGGNGRAPGQGQVAAYEFTEPAHWPAALRSVEADVTLANDPGNQVTAYLIAPGGQTMGYSSNFLTTGFTSGGIPVERPGRQLSVYVANPVPGTWTLILDFTAPVPGNELADAFAGRVRFNMTRAQRRGLPDSPSAVLARGKPVSYRVTIKNTGVAPEDVFLDPRLPSLSTYTLQPQDRATDITVPLRPSASPPEWIVPTMTHSVAATAASKVPVTFDFGPFPGDPDEPSTAGTVAGADFPAAAGRLATPVTQGLWSATPAQLGPFPAGGAPTATASMAMSATTMAFDNAVTVSQGDFWRFAVRPLAATASYRLFVIAPGQARAFTVTIDPTAASGTVVRGVLFVDYFTESLQFLSGTAMFSLPYIYKVG